MDIKINGMNGLSTVGQPNYPPAPTGEAKPVERAAPPVPEAEPAKKAGPKEVEQAVGKLNDLFLIFDKSVKMTANGKLGGVRVQIIDNKNNEVIREYPPETVVDMLDRIKQAVGVLIDEKV